MNMEKSDMAPSQEFSFLELTDEKTAKVQQPFSTDTLEFECRICTSFLGLSNFTVFAVHCACLNSNTLQEALCADLC